MSKFKFKLVMINLLQIYIILKSKNNLIYYIIFIHMEMVVRIVIKIIQQSNRQHQNKSVYNPNIYKIIFINCHQIHFLFLIVVIIK